MTTATTSDAPAKGPTKQLEEALHAHFIAPADRLSEAGAGAVYLTEVTAPGSSRRADVVHVGLWQSRGAGCIDVCELKTSRSDFLRELNDPAKAEAWWPYSTTFSIVVPHISIAHPDDMPNGWGLMVPGSRGRRFKVLVKPAEREPRITPSLLVTLLKNTETSRTNDLRHQRDYLQRQHTEQVRKLRHELRGTSDPDVRQRLALLDELEGLLGATLAEFAYRDQVSPAVAAAALKDHIAGHRALARAREDLTYRAAELDRLAVDLAAKAKDLRNAISPSPAREEV